MSTIVRDSIKKMLFRILLRQKRDCGRYSRMSSDHDRVRCNRGTLIHGNRHDGRCDTEALNQKLT